VRQWGGVALDNPTFLEKVMEVHDARSSRASCNISEYSTVGEFAESIYQQILVEFRKRGEEVRSEISSILSECAQDLLTANDELGDATEYEKEGIEDRIKVIENKKAVLEGVLSDLGGSSKSTLPFLLMPVASYTCQSSPGTVENETKLIDLTGYAEEDQGPLMNILKWLLKGRIPEG